MADGVAQEVAVLLQSAYFGAGAARRAAEETLLTALPRPGTVSALLAVAASSAVGDTLRVAAVMTLKQAVSRFWRGGEARGGTGLIEDEKRAVRGALLPLLEAPPTVSAQVAQVLAVVARFDFPSSWATLLDELAQRLREGGSSGVVRGLTAVLATLVSMRLPTAKATLGRLTGALLALLAPRLVEAFNSSSQLQGAAAECIAWVQTRGEQAKLELRSISRLLKHTRFMLESPAPAAEVLSLLASALAPLAQQVSLSSVPALSLWRAWIAGKLNRTLQATLEVQPLGFPLPLLASHLPYCASHIGAPAVPPNHPMEAFYVACILFLKTAADNSSFHMVPEAEAQRAAVAAFFTHEKLMQLCEALVSGPLVLAAAELEEWRATPEAFLQEDDADLWRVRLKHSAEAALLVLARPVLEVFVQRLQAQLSAATNDMQSLLLREARYHAAGTLAPLISERLDFGAWFASALQHELQVGSPAQSVLARRVCLLVASFATSGAVRAEHRPLLYERMVQCMSVGDLVVRVSAAEGIKALVFDTAFESSTFEPYITPCLQAIFSVLHIAKEEDSQLRILLILETVLAQLAGPSLLPHTQTLLQPLSEAWNSAGNAHMAKCAVLRILSQLVQTLGPHSQSLYSFLLPLIRMATSVGSTEELYLLEDGLDLWRELLAVAPVMDPAFLALYPAITALLARGYEQVGACTRIMELYLLLGQQAFIAEHGSALVGSITQILGDIRDEGLLLVLRVADTFTQMFPTAVPALEALLAKCLTLSLRDAESETPVALRHYLSLIARALLANAPALMALLQKAGPGAAAALMDVWADALDKMDQPFMRKLIALALVRMLACGAQLPGVLGRAGLMVAAVTSVLNDAEGGYDHFVVLEQDEAGPADSIVMRERGALYSRDPVNSLSLRSVAIATLREVASQHGEVVMSSVDPALLDALVHPPAPPNAPA